jgi:hypothetical protein
MDHVLAGPPDFITTLGKELSSLVKIKMADPHSSMICCALSGIGRPKLGSLIPDSGISRGASGNRRSMTPSAFSRQGDRRRRGDLALQPAWRMHCARWCQVVARGPTVGRGAAEPLDYRWQWESGLAAVLSQCPSHPLNDASPWWPEVNHAMITDPTTIQPRRCLLGRAAVPLPMLVM